MSPPNGDKMSHSSLEDVWEPEEVVEHWTEELLAREERGHSHSQRGAYILEMATDKDSWLRYYFDKKDPLVMDFLSEYLICATV